jgi:myo-inositol-1(or 4)-monophosphatase
MSRIELAKQISKKAGEMIMEIYKNSEKNHIHSKDHTEIVTDLDKEIDLMIRSKITEVFPEDDLVTEESENLDNVGNIVWYVDPIDGTDNFVWNIPCFCVSIAFGDEDEILGGVIYDPIQDELFEAEKGHGAKMNGQNIKVSKRSLSNLQMRGFGRGYEKKYQEQNLKLHMQLDAMYEKQRNLGSAAIMLAYVSCGRLDLVTLTGTKPWDSAAGSILVKEAGGIVSNFKGGSWLVNDDNIIASNSTDHEACIRITKNIV